MKRSKRKDLKVYCVCYENKSEDYDESVTILGCYFSEEVALQDLINALNF